MEQQKFTDMGSVWYSPRARIPITNLSGVIMIKPTVGRVVWFTPLHHSVSTGFTHHGGVEGSVGDQPHAAMIVYVWSDALVNLVVYDHDGKPHSRASVPLVQEGEPKPEEGYFASWMPFQVGQAKAQAAS